MFKDQLQWLPTKCPRCGCYDHWINTLAWREGEDGLREGSYRCMNFIERVDGFGDICDERIWVIE